MEEILTLFPEHVQSMFFHLPNWNAIEEIRLRIYSPIEIICAGDIFYLGMEENQFYVMTEPDVEYILNQLSEFSMYAFHEELKQGYITTRGGHRIGMGGQVVHENGKVQTLKHIRYFNIRLARHKKGAAEHYIEQLYRNGYDHTMIIGPPQSGKTTFLRDLARCASNGIAKKNIHSRKVAIVDERSELAACYQGIPSFDVGKRTDVLDNCPKAEGMMMMIRAMSPEIIIVDEIGRKEDAEAIMEAVHAGVTVICSVHGTSYSHVRKRPIMKELIDNQIFTHYVTLDRSNGNFTFHYSSERKMAE